jgi:flagellar M-ring protein FliF
MTFVERFRSSTPRTQLLLWGGLGVVVLALLIAAYLLFIRRPYDVLFNNMRTMDAATIVAQLDKDKIPYRLEDQGTTLLVPADIVDQTRLNIMSADLPLKGMVGFELFNKSDMGLTEFAQRINYQRALQGELARTIMTIETVDTARVHLSLPEQTVFREDRRAPGASVTIQTRPGRVLSASAVRGIQRLVAAAVPDMSISDVVILDQAGEEVSGVSLTAQNLSGVDYADQGVESTYAARISDALARDYPQTAASVQVWADIDVNSIKAADPALGPSAPGPEIAAARPYRLRVAVLVAPETSAAERQAIRTSVIAAAGLDSTKGDVLSITSGAGPMAARPIPPPIPAVAPVARSVGHGPSFGFGLTVSLALAALLAVALAGIYLARRTPPRRALSEAEREAMAQDLRRLLDQRTANGSVAA